MSYLHTIFFLICLSTTLTFTHLIPVTWASLLYRTRPTDIPTPGPGPRFPWGPHGSPFVVFWPLLSVICSRRLSCFPSPTKSFPPCLLSFFYNVTPADSVLCVYCVCVPRWNRFPDGKDFLHCSHCCCQCLELWVLGTLQTLIFEWMNHLREFQKYRKYKIYISVFIELIDNCYIFDILKIWNAYENLAY